VKPFALNSDSKEIYLDCNATTPVLPQIADAVSHTMETIFGNPSSSHVTGLKARYILDTTRQLARRVVGASSGKLIFTSGATEGIQTAVVSAIRAAVDNPQSPRSYLLYGATEHKAVPQALQHWNQLLGLNAELKAIPVNEQGILDHEFIAEHVGQAAMICTMAANNETGVKQDLSALEQTIRTHAPEVPWMVDCVQALGKLPLALDDISIDYAPFSGHKLYGPKGIGFMAVRESAPFTPLIIGGGQESGYRSGTENLPGIAALHALFELMLDPTQTTFVDPTTLEHYREQLARTLRQAFPSIVFNHDFSVSVPTTLNFSVKGVSSKDIMDVLDASHIRVSSGSACSSKVTRSFVLDAMGLSDWQSESAIRMSFGPATTQATVDKACERIQLVAQALQQSCLIVADTNNDHDAQLDGVVQLKYDDHCCYVLIDREAREVAIIDPHPALAGRLENLVRCQNYDVQGVLVSSDDSDVQQAASMLRAMLIGAEPNTDMWGWPEHAIAGCDAVPAECDCGVQGCLSVGQRRLFKLGDELPTFLLSEPVKAAESLRVDFAFLGAHQAIRDIQHCISDTTLVCPRKDGEHQLVLAKSMQSGAASIVEDTQALWERDDITIIDVRERQEHVVDDLPAHASVVNVPLTEAIQFIHEHPQLKSSPLVCVCRSGQRSGVMADALTRLGFTKVQHLSGGLALASTPV
jgi:cysteine sulfinate desulfinase/cysteine desulfurase-like protein/rhodanese-related sulfurtransferase